MGGFRSYIGGMYWQNIYAIFACYNQPSPRILIRHLIPAFINLFKDMILSKMEKKSYVNCFSSVAIKVVLINRNYDVFKVQILYTWGIVAHLSIGLSHYNEIIDIFIAALPI